MIHVRDTFNLKFGAARDARPSIEAFGRYLDNSDYGDSTLFTDFTGSSYRVVLEGAFENLADYENRLASAMSTDEWRRIYQEFSSHVDSSSREIFRRFDY